MPRRTPPSWALYRYVESKEALFHVALLYAMDARALPELAVPLPMALQTVRFLILAFVPADRHRAMNPAQS